MLTPSGSPKPPTPPPQTTAFHLTKGAEVEVSSDDEGFRGAWYRARVIELPPKTNLKKRKKALIEYVYLLADDGSTPLTEYVDPAFIRPLPPVEDGRVFAQNDVVEARYRDGWWTGIVRKVLEGSNYRVYFDNPPDVIEFNGKDLRIHLKWARGDWVPSRKHQAQESNFSSGTSVEVIIDKEKLKDIWFPAIVIKELENNTFFVKYKSLSADDEIGEEKLTLGLQCIRPAPAQNVKRNFELLEKVDAVYNGGWRVGLITKVLTGGRYNVFFKLGNEDKELSHSDIRPHVDWSGDYQDPKSKEVPVVSDNQDHLGSSKDADNNVIDTQLKSSANETDKTKEQTPCSIKTRKKWARPQTPSTENPTLPPLSPTKKRIKLEASNPSTVSSRPLKKLSEENATVEPLPSQNGVPRKTTREKSEFLSRLATPKRRAATKLPVSDQSSAPIQTPLVRTKRIKQEKPKDQNQKVDPVKTKRIQKKAKDSSAVMGGTADIPTADNEDEQKVEISGTSVILGLVAGKGKGSGVASPQPVGNLKQKENLGDSTKGKSGKGSSQRRKRGRPRKWPLVVKTGNESSGAGDLADSTGDWTAVTGRDSPDPKMTADDEISNDNVDDDQPLSTWIGVHTSTNLEESKKQTGNGFVGKQIVNGFTESKDMNIDAKKISEQGSESAKIPFMKKSPVWETIESMEVFKVFPQEPHFSPLSEVKEEYREGSAIGMMITFGTLFEKISKLQIDYPKSVFDSTLESLDDFEKHGFDITVLKGRVNELLAVKVEKDMLQSEFSDTDRSMIKHSCEKAKYEVEMREIKNKIAELQELHKAAESKKDAVDQEAARRKLEIETIRERIMHAQSKFANAVSAPWKLG